MATWSRNSSRAFLFALVLLFALPTILQAQEDYDDPPARVARLSYASGSVSFQPAGTEDWVQAIVNRPIGTGDTLWSDQGSRVALHIGSASIVLGENTGFSFLNLTDNVAQIQLQTGTIRVRVKRLGDDENFEIDTPNLAYTILTPGIYELTVTPDGQTTIIEDRAGEGEAYGGGQDLDTEGGDYDTFQGTDQLYVTTDSIYDNDDEFEQWCERRDHHEDNSISVRYVSDDVIGYDDLDDYGGWRQVPEYGTIWFPHTVAVDWAPYHYGHWAYVAPWGYTWVDDAPWGFAPFHYGRWVYVGNAWGWVPAPPRPVGYYNGPEYVRPVYAPALVAWVGGVGGAGVAWFPLGPREVYVPSYPVSRDYVTRINVSNTTVNTTVVNNYYTTVIVNKTVNVTNVTYVNQRVPGAVVATSSQAFSTGQPVARNFVKVDARAVSTAPVVAVTPATVPQREAVLGGRPAATAKPPAAIQARAIVAKTAPPPPPPSFTQRQAAIQSNGGRPLSVAQVRQIQPARSATVVAAKVKIETPKANPAPMRAAPATQAQRAANPTYKPGAQPAPRPPAPVVSPARAAAIQRPANAPAPAPAANANENRPPASQPIANASRPASAPPAANVAKPPTAHPMDDQLEQKHQQEAADLHKQQDEERQQLEQKQQQEQQQLQQQKAKAKQQEQLAQQHEQELKAQQEKQKQEQQQLQEKQEQEHKQAAEQQKAKPETKDNPPPKKP
jgi:hypothetical protein